MLKKISKLFITFLSFMMCFSVCFSTVACDKNGETDNGGTDNNDVLTDVTDWNDGEIVFDGAEINAWRNSILSTYNKFYTFSFDDGVTQDERLITLLKKYGLTATFNINSGLLGNKSQMNVAVPEENGGLLQHNYVTEAQITGGLYDGMEVASHTNTHLSLVNDGHSDSTRVNQVNVDVAKITQLTNKKVVGLAYPGPGQKSTYDYNTNRHTMKLLYDNTSIKYARTITSTEKFDLPNEWLLWNPTCYLQSSKLETLQEEFRNYKPDDGEYALFYGWGHSYDFDQFYSQDSLYDTDGVGDYWDRIERFFKSVSEDKDAICLTNEQIYYLFNNTIKSYKPTKFVTMSFDDGTVYDKDVIKILNKYNLTATFCINSNLLGTDVSANSTTYARLTQTDIQQGVYDGMDVIAHGENHAPGGFAMHVSGSNLDTRPTNTAKWNEQTITAEMQNDVNAIARLVGVKPIGCAYPGGDSYINNYVIDVIKNNTTLKYGRMTSNTGSFGLPDDFMRWWPTCSAYDGTMTECLNRFLGEESESDSLLYLWDHPWNIQHYGKWQAFENFCKTISENEEIVCLSNTDIYYLFNFNKKL